MRTVNKVILIGNVAKDPLVRATQGGVKNALFVVATNRVFKDKTGQIQNEAEFSNCIAWGPLADRCEKYLKKGKLVYIEGRLKTRTNQKEDGTRTYRTEIVVLNLIFLNKRDEFETEGGSTPAAEVELPEETVDAVSHDTEVEAVMDDNTF